MTSLGIEKKVLYEIVIYRILFYFILSAPVGISPGIVTNKLLFEKFATYFFSIEDKQLLLSDFKVKLDTIFGLATLF